MEDLQKRLNDLLQGTARKRLKLSVTPCILAELKSLGADFQGQPQMLPDDHVLQTKPMDGLLCVMGRAHFRKACGENTGLLFS